MGYLILIIIGGIVAFSLISWICKKISEAQNKRRQKVLDEIAQDTLAGFDFNKEKGGIKSIVSQYVTEVFRCPKCNGMLVLGDGIYGKFLGCSRYPKCKYTRRI